MRTLVDKLQATGHHSDSLERLKEHLSVEESHNALEAEIRQEMASALGRASAKIDLAVVRLELALTEYERAPAPDREPMHPQLQRLHAQAQRARLDLVIHREAIGLRDNALVSKTYPIPALPKGCSTKLI